MNRGFWVGVVVASAGFATPALAQSASILDCVALVDDARRLACYDAAAEAMGADQARAAAARREEAARARQQQAAAEAARKAEEVRLAEAAKAKAQVDTFGKSGGEQLAAAGVDSIDELPGKVSEVFSDAAGRLIIVLENGQMWRQNDGGSLPTVRPGDVILIKKGSLGSFRMTFERIRRTITVRRYR